MGRKAVSYLLYLLAVVFTGLLLGAAILSWRASYVSPAEGRFWMVIAMLMPILLLANLTVMVWWLFRRKWLVALLPLAALLFNYEYISAMVQWPWSVKPQEQHDVRIATLNVNGFRRMGSTPVTVRAVAQMMARERVDVLCLQEFLDERKFSVDSIRAVFSDRMPYFISEGSAAVVSRFPILDYGYVCFPDTANDYLWADLTAGQDTLRVFSVHLQTSGVAHLRRRFQEDYGREVPVDTIVGMLEHNSRIRAEQVHEIHAATDRSPYPVILVGDFNDMPSSYTYRQIKGDLIDGFQACGRGYAGTFRYLGGVLRIDYIFYEAPFFKGVDYRILSEDVSDHRTVIADLKFNGSSR